MYMGQFVIFVTACQQKGRIEWGRMWRKKKRKGSASKRKGECKQERRRGSWRKRRDGVRFTQRIRYRAEQKLYKLEHYGIRRAIYLRPSLFLTQWTHKIIIESVSSLICYLKSGVHEGTVLRPLALSCCILRSGLKQDSSRMIAFWMEMAHRPSSTNRNFRQINKTCIG